MPTYVLLSKLTDDGAETLVKNPGRVQEVNQEIERYGVRVREQFALLGPYDFLNIVEAPDNTTIARIAAELSARGSVQIMSLAAIPMEEFVTAMRR